MSQDSNVIPWGAQDRFQAHFIVKVSDLGEGSEFLAKTELETKGHFALKQVSDVNWTGGKLAEYLTSDNELKNMILNLPYEDAHIWVEPTKNGVRIHGKWKSSYEFSMSKELFAVYDKIAHHIKNNLY